MGMRNGSWRCRDGRRMSRDDLVGAIGYTRKGQAGVSCSAGFRSERPIRISAGLLVGCCGGCG